MIGLHQIKHADNLANIVRTCSAYGVGSVQTSGPRIIRAMKETRHRVFRHKDYASVQISLLDALQPPTGAIPVAIEIVEGAQSLPWFQHPENAFYIFGPEDGTLPSHILRQCHHIVSIPMAHCINLSHAVSTVLYDREMKRIIKE